MHILIKMNVYLCGSLRYTNDCEIIKYLSGQYYLCQYLQVIIFHDAKFDITSY